MKSFQDLRVVGLGIAGTVVSIIAMGALLNCGGGSGNSTPPGVVSLGIAADGSCTPRLVKDLTQYLDSCKDYRGEHQDHKIEKMKKLAEDCNQFTQTYGEAVVCNLTDLSDFGNRDRDDLRDCLKLSDDQTDLNGVFQVKVKGLHEYCGGVVTEYSNQVQQGPPPGFVDNNDSHRSHRSHISHEDD